MDHPSWQELIEHAQRALRERPDHCFVCGRAVPESCRLCAVQAFLDAAQTHRLAVVCERTACLLALADAHTGT